MQPHVLVTGGAGYIGSHVVRQLGERGDAVVTLDDLSTGHREAVLHGDLVVGSAGDPELVREVLRDYAVHAVLHFAASTVVPESVSRPLAYYANNTLATHTLLDACAERGVDRFIFSSTAAVYGIPDADTVDEDAPTRPINPYGSSKLAAEWMIADLARATRLHHVMLRYFNVAGCDPEGRIGQSTPDAHLLVKVAAEAAIGKRDHVAIYGTDYPTRDGTGVRDYIHVEDVASAHLRALDYLAAGGESTVLNLGYGHGATVREVIDTVQRVSGRAFPVRETDRRPGDPPALVADAQRIRRVLGWTPQHDDLEQIARTAVAWERRLGS